MSRARREFGSVHKRGDRYYARWSDAQGRRRWKVAGDRYSDATRLLEQLRAQVEAERRGEAAEALTLGEWWERDYLAVLASRLGEGGLKTARSNLQRVADWLFDHRGDPYMHEVTRGDAEDCVAALFAEGLEPGYVRRIVSTTRRAWNDARTRGLVTTNPWAKLKMRPARPPRVPWVEPAQLRELYEALPLQVRPHLVLVGETGLRIGEALALRREDVDLEARRLHVRAGKTAAARRTVPLSGRAVALLEQLLERPGGREDLVLPQLSGETLRRGLTEGCAAVGIQRITPHKLRHTFASHLVQAGVAATTVASILGHADGGVLVMRLYGRWMPQDAETRALEVLSAMREPEAVGV